jgi:AIG2-like family
VALYAAYGSNMDPAQMLLRCPHSPQRGTGWLEGWRLSFGGEDLGWDGALSTVVEDPAHRVFVALYDVPEIDEKELDSWDGVNLGFYRKLKVRVQALDGDALAWLYVLDAYEGGLPSDRRLTILVDAALKAGAPADYVDWLRARPSNPPNAQLSPGGATPRTPRCPPGAGLIAKTAILSGPPPANQSCGDSVPYNVNVTLILRGSHYSRLVFVSADSSAPM